MKYSIYTEIAGIVTANYNWGRLISYVNVFSLGSNMISIYRHRIHITHHTLHATIHKTMKSITVLITIMIRIMMEVIITMMKITNIANSKLILAMMMLFIHQGPLYLDYSHQHWHQEMFKSFRPFKGVEYDYPSMHALTSTSVLLNHCWCQDINE